MLSPPPECSLHDQAVQTMSFSFNSRFLESANVNSNKPSHEMYADRSSEERSIDITINCSKPPDMKEKEFKPIELYPEMLSPGATLRFVKSVMKRFQDNNDWKAILDICLDHHNDLDKGSIHSQNNYNSFDRATII